MAVEKSEGFDALMWAAAEGNALVVRLLIDAGADVKRKDKDGETAYDFAKKNGHQAVAKMLSSS